MYYSVSVERTVKWHEFAELMASVGWGDGYDEALFLRSYHAYPLVAHARAEDGTLLGYVSAFSDGVFSTMLGELVVRPSAQGHGIGRTLMATVEAEFAGVPIYIKAMGAAKHFFRACGYREASTEMTVMYKKVTACQPTA